MTPSETLTAAADRIRDLAVDTASSPSPWRSSEYQQEGYPNVLDIEGSPLFSSSCCGGHCYGHVTDQGDARWIAALSPAIAPMLEAWLRREAEHIAPVEHLLNRSTPALAFARVILGEDA